MLGKSTDEELLVEWPNVQRDSKGRFYATGTLPRSKILVYDSRGRYLRKLGRSGAGPGEFSSILRLLSLPGDSLIVIDGGNRRVSILGPSGEHVRSFTTPLLIRDFAMLSAPSWMASGMSFDESLVGFPLHRFDRGGRIEASFGGDVIVSESRPSAAQRLLATDLGGVWTARPDRYEIEFWTPAGVRKVLMTRNADWFPNRETEGARNRWPEPITPRLRDMHVDGQGRLWIMGTVAKQGWIPTQENWSGIEADDENLDMMLEVIDPRDGRLLMSERLPWVASGFTAEGLIVSYRMSDSGHLELRILRVRFPTSGGTL